MDAPELKIGTFPDPIYAQNARVIGLEGDAVCWLVDPGLPPSARQMLTCLDRNRLRPEAIVLTHAHADHIAGLPEVLSAFPKLPVYLAKPEWSFLADPSKNLSIMSGIGLMVEVQEIQDLVPGQRLTLGHLTWEILDTSGHSPGGRTLYCGDARVAVVGDALFAGGIGRTDFPHSDGPLLLSNIREHLLVLPGETVVLSGHGPDTTIEAERENNPFVGRWARAEH